MTTWPLVFNLPFTRYIIALYCWKPEDNNIYYKTIDERTAQHGLCFIVLLTCCFVELDFLVRFCLAAIFILGGINNTIMGDYNYYLCREGAQRLTGIT
eukprot:UN07437